MKGLIYVMIICTIGLTACCKKIQVLPGLGFNYTKIDQEVMITEFLMDANDSLYSYSTFFESNQPLEHFISFDKRYLKYIVQVYTNPYDTSSTNLIYSDTVSHVHYELTGRCNNKISDFYYMHNGEIKTESRIYK